MIGDFGRSVGRAVMDRAGRFWSRFQEASALEADLLESDDAYLVVIDAPGATASDVQVRYADGSVFVRIDRFRDFYEDFEMRFPGRGMALDSQVELPEDAVVQPTAGKATLRDDGTLEIRIPKGVDEDAPEDPELEESETEATAEPGG